MAYFFDLPDSTYTDENYIFGKLVRCFDGFCKEMLSKIWNVFHDPLLVASSLRSALRPVANPDALQLH